MGARWGAEVWLRVLGSLVVLLALGLRLHHLDYESLFMDELRQVSYYRDSFGQIVWDAVSQQQPPLDYWIGHLVHRVADSDFAYRLPAALFGTGAVGLLMLLAARLYGRPVALGTGLVAALLPFNVYFSQEARPYAIATFLLLLILWAFGRLMEGRSRRWTGSLVLLLAATALLYSRGFSPLVVVTTLGGLTGAHLVWSLYRQGWRGSELQHRLLASLLACAIAGLAFVPMLRLQLDNGGHYVTDTDLGVGWEALARGLHRLDLGALWRAYAVQSEPLTWPLLVLVLLAPLVAWRSGQWRRHLLWPYLWMLLLLEPLLEMVIFAAKSAYPYRPPYAIALLPLVLLLAAGTVHGLLAAVRGGALRTAAPGLAALLLVVLAAVAATSTLEAKQLRKKTDWRGAYAYMSRHYGPRHAIIFASLTLPGRWEPIFYGHSRYYTGHSVLLSSGELPGLAERMRRTVSVPVLLLFQWREYRLTAGSPYAFIPTPGADPGRPPVADYSPLLADPRLRVQAFRGLYVVELRNYSGNTLADSYRLLATVLRILPQDRRTLDNAAVAAKLAQALGKKAEAQDWRRLSERLSGDAAGKPSP